MTVPLACCLAAGSNLAVIAAEHGRSGTPTSLRAKSPHAASAVRQNFVFRDVGNERGIRAALEGIQGHGAAWGDIDGDGSLDLYVGTFLLKDGTKPNVLLRGGKDRFHLDEQKPLQIPSRSTGIVFADLDNDGDLDLYVSSMPQPKNRLVGCTLFRNEGGGRFTDVSSGNAACPPDFGGRSVAVFDYDGDGRLDLLVGEDPVPGYNGSKTKSSRLLRNRGDLQFEDVSRAAGLPAQVPGLGVAAADVNNDGWPDLFLASANGGNVLFLNDRNGRFREAPGSREVFAWKEAGDDNMVCGVCFGDVNRDGLLDVVLGQHFATPWKVRAPHRLYLNRGIQEGVPRYEEVTAAVGLVPMPMKGPHVEIQDFDNDGWPDIFASTIIFKDGKPHPLIFKHLGLTGGEPRFGEDGLALNDFPTEEDKAIKKGDDFWDKVRRENKIIYMAPGPSADYDTDGRLDLFLPSWWTDLPSLLLHNETSGGSWLQVQMQGGDGVNRMGIGTRVNVFSAGGLGQASALIGCREIAVGFGYASGQPAVAHFGLGRDSRVDIELILPHGKGRRSWKSVKANQRLTLK